jgi:hypothetical protein
MRPKRVLDTLSVTSDMASLASQRSAIDVVVTLKKVRRGILDLVARALLFLTPLLATGVREYTVTCRSYVPGWRFRCVAWKTIGRREDESELTSPSVLDSGNQTGLVEGSCRSVENV